MTLDQLALLLFLTFPCIGSAYFINYMHLHSIDYMGE